MHSVSALALSSCTNNVFKSILGIKTELKLHWNFSTSENFAISAEYVSVGVPYIFNCRMEVGFVWLLGTKEWMNYSSFAQLGGS